MTATATTKLPIGETVNEAFRFGLRRWGTVLKFFWLPAVLGYVLVVAAIMAMIDFKGLRALSDSKSEDPAYLLSHMFNAPLPVVIAVVLAASLIYGLLISGGAASVFRLVVHGEERPGVFQLRFDGPALRTFAAYFIVVLISLTITLLCMGIAAIAHHGSLGDIFNAYADFIKYSASAKGGRPDPDIIANLEAQLEPFTLGSRLAMLPRIYFAVALAPFVAGTAAENRLLLLGSFRLTSGNWWRILAAYALMVIALVLIIIAAVLGIWVLILLGAVLAKIAPIFSVALWAAVFVAVIFLVLFKSGVTLAFQGIVYRRLAYGD